MMFVPCKGITGTFHKVLTFYIKFPQAVDYNMYMNIATSIVSVCMCADESLMSGKILFCIFQT